MSDSKPTNPQSADTLVIDKTVEARPEHVDEIMAGIRSGQVRVTTSPEDEERQRARKLVELAEATREGKLPTTAQAVEFIENIEGDKTLEKKTAEMGPEGRRVVSDATRALDSTKRLLTELNPNDQLQRLIFYTSRAAQTISENAQRQDVPPEATKEAQSALQNLRESVDRATHIARLLATSSEFRTVINDALNLVSETLQTQGGDTGKTLADITPRASTFIQDDEKQQNVKNKAGEAKDTLSAKGDEARKTLFQPGDKSIADRLDEASGKGIFSVSLSRIPIEDSPISLSGFTLNFPH